jgi:hypothetical protein
MMSGSAGAGAAVLELAANTRFGTMPEPRAAAVAAAPLMNSLRLVFLFGSNIGWIFIFLFLFASDCSLTIRYLAIF